MCPLKSLASLQTGPVIGPEFHFAVLADKHGKLTGASLFYRSLEPWGRPCFQTAFVARSKGNQAEASAVHWLLFGLN